ncbi:hypothetical protein YC2023_079847 [Brassica napus]
MAITQLHFSDLKAGRLEDRVVTSLLRFWEARNIKKSGELMSVDFIFLNEKEKYRATTVTTFKTIGGNAENNYGFKRRVDVSRYLCAEALLNEEDENGYSDWKPVQQKMPVEFVKCVCNYLSEAYGYSASLLFKRHWSLTEVEEKCGGKILLLFGHVVKIYCYFGTTLSNFK